MKNFETIKIKGNVLKIKSNASYTSAGGTLCKITNTGNGYICKFPSWASTQQDYYVCLNYEQADYLAKGLTAFMNQPAEQK
jgi:hypothetical protein